MRPKKAENDAVLRLTSHRRRGPSSRVREVEMQLFSVNSPGREESWYLGEAHDLPALRVSSADTCGADSRRTWRVSGQMFEAQTVMFELLTRASVSG
uniref:Uncharacterized protein n=1 Tax=Knipowitschia caucasica TaxID=637954 RepID=A0AAV2K685_KNICA